MSKIESKLTTLIRYIVWVLFAVLTMYLLNSSTSHKGFNSFMIILFALVGIVTVAMMQHRYKHENEMLGISEPRLRDVITENFGFVFWMVVLIGAVHLSINALQIQGVIPRFYEDANQATDLKVLGFNLLAAIFIISPQQAFVAHGFFFRYFFSKRTSTNRTFGILFSGIIYGIITIPQSYQQFLFYVILGWIFAYIYTRTDSIKLSIAVITFSNVMAILLV